MCNQRWHTRHILLTNTGMTSTVLLQCPITSLMFTLSQQRSNWAGDNQSPSRIFFLVLSNIIIVQISQTLSSFKTCYRKDLQSKFVENNLQHLEEHLIVKVCVLFGPRSLSQSFILLKYCTIQISQHFFMTMFTLLDKK